MSTNIYKAYQYIKQNATAWAITYEDETVIDKINIRQATLSSMHKSIKKVMRNHSHESNLYNSKRCKLLIDGTDFKQMV